MNENRTEQSFWGANRTLINVFSMLFLSIIVFALWYIYIEKTGDKGILEMPVTVSPAGIVEQDITYKSDEKYNLDLCFHIGHGLGSEQLRKLIGENRYFEKNGKRWADKTGVPVVVRASLFDRKSGGEIKSTTEYTRGAYSIAPDICRQIGFYIPQGGYKLKVEILRDVPEFKNVKIFIRAYRSTCNSASCLLQFYGFYAIVLVILPILGMLGLGLVSQIIAYYVASRKSISN